MNPMTGDDIKSYNYLWRLVLAMHKTILEGDLKEQYKANLKHYDSVIRQHEGGNILKDLLPLDLNEPDQPKRSLKDN
ncbi:MAG TPA: hypothetical protein VGM30_14995 [Puia sp.]|jgi:hypothetical protein